MQVTVRLAGPMFSSHSLWQKVTQGQCHPTIRVMVESHQDSLAPNPPLSGRRQPKYDLISTEVHTEIEWEAKRHQVTSEQAKRNILLLIGLVPLTLHLRTLRGSGKHLLSQKVIPA